MSGPAGLRCGGPGGALSEPGPCVGEARELGSGSLRGAEGPRCSRGRQPAALLRGGVGEEWGRPGPRDSVGDCGARIM